MAICSLVCATLRHMSIGGGVVLTVTFQKVDAAPHAQAAAQRDNQSLQNLNRLCKEIHRSILLSFVGIIRLKVGRFQFVHLERLVRLYDGRFAFHVPFHIKEVFLVGVGGVLVVGVLRQVVLVREEGTHAPQHEDTLASVHYRQFVLGHQLFATMSSDELKKQHRTNSEICSMLLYITKYYNLTPISELLFGFEIVCHIAAFS